MFELLLLHLVYFCCKNGKKSPCSGYDKFVKYHGKSQIYYIKRTEIKNNNKNGV